MLFGRSAEMQKKNDIPDASQRGRRAIARACALICEPLEKRQMLTALVNGRFTGTGTQFDGQTIFEYRQANGDQAVRISVKGNISAEFIAGTYVNGHVSLSDLTPVTVTTGTSFLFSIYVTKSDINSTISIASVAAPTARNRPMDPLLGNFTVRYNNATTGVSETTSLQGGVFIGAASASDIPPTGDSIPAFVSGTQAFGMRPASAGLTYAGLQVAPGNDLGQFFVGGAITGVVNVPGNMKAFYANNILTGNDRGIGANSSSRDIVTIPNNNFHVGGDLGNLITLGSLGTDTLVSGTPDQVAYKTGFDLDVSGRLGQVKAVDSILGEVEIHANSTVKGTGIAQKEFEVRGNTLGNGNISYFDPQFFGNNIGIGAKSLNTSFFNDTFDTAQWLGTSYSRTIGSTNAIDLLGSLNNNNTTGFTDGVDYYAVPMLAGQSMVVQVIDRASGTLTGANEHLGIFDPDGRLIATDYNAVNDAAHNGEAIQIKADRPGSYRIAIASNGDVNFNGVGDPGESLSLVNPQPYELRVTDVGNLAVGGIIAGGNIGTLDTSNRGIQVDHGDLGEVRAGTQVAANTTGSGTIFSDSPPWYVVEGNFRVLEGGDLGIIENGNTIFGTSGPDLRVRLGSVGLIRTFDTSTNGFLSIDDDANYPKYTDNLAGIDSSLAVGGNIQMVDAAGDLEGAYLAKGSIGVIRGVNAGSEQTSTPPIFIADADHKGRDGTIDLISFSGNFNSPAIYTGPGGDVRYMEIGGTLNRDIFFGGGTPDVLTSSPGASLTVTDDSGTQIILTPGTATSGIIIGTTATTSYLQTTVYPIRSGGEVIVDVTVVPGAGTVSAGLTARTSTLGASQTAEISRISLSGTGAPVTFNPATQTYTSGAGLPLNVNITGSGTIDVWNIINTAGGTFNSILNSTNGEIVNVGESVTGATTTSDINLLQAGSVGVAKTHAATVVAGKGVQDNSFPYVQQRTLIRAGDLVTVRSRGAVGNILATNIGTIIANSDNKDAVSGNFEGINAPIVSRQSAASALQGNINNVQIGDGVLPSGSGLVGFAGIYADETIGTIVGTGKGHDIRGDIVAANTAIATPLGFQTSAIRSIRLDGGSIIDSHIFTTAVAQASDIYQGSRFAQARNTSSLDNPVPDIASIKLTGNGGILGSYIFAFNIGTIDVGGFGIFSTVIQSVAGGSTDSITAAGLGIQNCNIFGGVGVSNINATGTGKRVKTSTFSSSVRISEIHTFDPYSGIMLDGFNDLDKNLGTTKTTPSIKGISDTGIIADTQISGSGTLGNVTAHRILARSTTTLNSDGTKTKIPLSSLLYPMRIAFGTIGTIQTRDVIDGLSVTAGNIGHFNPGKNAQNARIQTSGTINAIDAGAALRGTISFITGGGINVIKTRNSMYANISASGSIQSISVGTDLGSNSLHTLGNLGTLTVKGSILNGALVNVKHTIGHLNIGRDLQARATVRAHVIQNQKITGQVLGALQIV